MSLFKACEVMRVMKDYGSFVRDKDPIPKDHLVRYEAHDTSLHLYRTPILRYTKAGCWIGYDEANKKFILKGKGKRFAYETEQEAFDSLLIRKQCYVKHTTRSFNRATKHLELVEGLRESV